MKYNEKILKFIEARNLNTASDVEIHGSVRHRKRKARKVKKYLNNQIHSYFSIAHAASR